MNRSDRRNSSGALSGLPNPFDFANPVSTKTLFIGRTEERQDIEYYLEHARYAERSINLALLGERAAGKTSLLNMIELEARARDLVPVRIDLNESDVDYPLAFWFKIVGGIFHEIVKVYRADGQGLAFGGETGKTFDVYLDMVTSSEIPEDKTFCPFLFPIQYAKAMGAGNPAARVSDYIIKRDLKAMADEVGRPIVLLVDECNILSRHRALLEMVRNTFMNLPGYMLVFTGTPDLFPLMDEVFSPIVRQFKRIELKPFADIRDTCGAVKEPLRSVGKEDLFPILPDEMLEELRALQAPWELGGVLLEGVLKDLHDLTGGRPYEIQLVCHFMFRRVQRQKDTHMRLGMEVLEDVLRELRQSQDVDARPVISAVRALDEDQLKNLSVLLCSGGRIPVEQVVFWAVVCGESESPKELRKAYQEFVHTGILRTAGDACRFNGDAFDRIVCKYAARQRQTYLPFEFRPLSSLFDERVVQAFHRRSGKAVGKRREGMFTFALREGPGNERFQDWEAGWASLVNGCNVLELCRRAPAMIEMVYPHMVGDGDMTLQLALCRVVVEGCGVRYDGLYGIVGEAAESVEERMCELVCVLGEMKSRAAMFGGCVTYERKDIEPSSSQQVVGCVVEMKEREALLAVINEHATRMYHLYTGGTDAEVAVEHAQLAALACEVLEADDINNVGFVLLSGGRHQEAERVLQLAVERVEGVSLYIYNLALAVMKKGDCRRSRSLLREVLELEKEAAYEDAGVLLIPHLSSGELCLRERWSRSMREESDFESLSLPAAAQEAIQVLDAIET